MTRANFLVRICAASVLLLAMNPLNAGFLEMPDTTEVPQMERESLLKDLDIPPVRDRDPNPMGGPRLNVTEFRVQGLVEYPELGITRESLTQLVEGIRFDMMAEGEMLESGYTLEEVSEISDLIAEIEEETQDEYVGPLDVQRLVFLIREQRQRRGVTLGMIESVADTITRYYRERGFILAKAYIPQQRVRDGVVTLTLLLGNLGEVKVHNNQKYSAKIIENIFARDMNKPVKSDLIEETLYFVNDLPGLSAQAYFEPGAQVGDTRLSINVMDEDQFASNLRVDNHGSTNTGEYRLYADTYWNNPFGLGDQLHIGVLGTVDPTNSLYGSLHYGLPLFKQRGKFTIGGSTNDFVSQSITGLSLTGRSAVIDASFNYILQRSRVKNYSLEVRTSHIKTDIENRLNTRVSEAQSGSAASESIDQGLAQLGDVDFDSEVSNLDFLFTFDVLLENVRALHQGGVRLTVADIKKGQGANQKRNPVIISADYSLLKFFRFPFSDAQTRGVFKLSGQYADGSVPSTNQFALAGPNKMRSLPINQYNADSGLYGAVDWMFNAPSFLSFDIAGDKLSDILQPYVFYELAYGDATPAEAGEGTWAGVTGMGLGLKLTVKNRFRASMSYARAINYLQDVGLPLRLKEHDLPDQNNFYFDMQYSF